MIDNLSKRNLKGITGSQRNDCDTADAADIPNGFATTRSRKLMNEASRGNGK